MQIFFPKLLYAFTNAQSDHLLMILYIKKCGNATFLKKSIDIYAAMPYNNVATSNFQKT